ncbi:hypothetical protein O6H91_02G098500 [Diphasiastrum complanatum]|uniref:Uncharacterized protein n=1 Tax=Diphasiastrum complanatum TaxID=34168 RepID=A0ACC2EIG8_DIPCM|nr:hypothetical protein O6H91_02G098500 [Diphasiastrum complanatum]
MLFFRRTRKIRVSTGGLGRVRVSKKSSLEFFPSSLRDSNFFWTSIQDNELTRSISYEPRQMTTLQTLSLNNNKLEEPIRSAFGGLTNLTSLDFSSNSLINGSIPQKMENFRLLETLVLSGNNLSGTILDHLGNCSALVTIKVSNNKPSGGIPTILENCTNVTRSRLANNLLGRDFSMQLNEGQLKSLPILCINNNRFSGSVPESLAQYINLTLVDFNKTSPAEVYHYNNTTSILPNSRGPVLRYNQLKGPIPAWI